jgi:ABC-type nitrate/sulfonate/bicarbonate transport system substrate-binding protein
VRCDVDPDPSAGGATNLLSAFEAGKYDGLVDNAPDIFWVSAGTIQIPLYKLEPISAAATNMLVTTESMIQGHPDVVQAVVTAMVKAAMLGQQSAGAAYQDSVTSGLWFKVSGLTAISQYHQLFDLWLPSSFQPAISTQAWQNLEKIDPAVVSKVSFGTFVDNSFANNAIKELGASYPAGPAPSGH